ncbi:AAA family ATPase [Streptomyces sp. NPDC004166]
MTSAPARVLRPQHFLDTPDTALVATDLLLEAQDTIRDTIEARAIAVIYGDAGLGKTFAARAALQETAPELLLSLEFTRSRPGPGDLREALFHQMGLPGPMPKTPSPMYRLLRTHLPRRPYVIVCDEAQQYRRQCFEFIRNLWDNCRKEDNRPAVLFIGGREAYDTLQSDPALASRIHIRQEALAMSEEETLKTIPCYHPVWREADPQLLKYIDKAHAAGVFRRWSNITQHVLTALQRLDKQHADQEAADWALARC